MKPEEQFFPQYEICKNEEGKPILLGRGGFPPYMRCAAGRLRGAIMR